MTMFKRLLALSSVALSLDSFAQDSTSSKQLDEVVVTANKMPQKQTTTGKVVAVISKEQI
jgi:vitamin B12 transporter